MKSAANIEGRAMLWQSGSSVLVQPPELGRFVCFVPLQEQEHTMQIMLPIAVKMLLVWFSPQVEIKQQPPQSVLLCCIDNITSINVRKFMTHGEIKSKADKSVYILN